jgi:endonuclease YncB( thermonuclease family)
MDARSLCFAVRLFGSMLWKTGRRASVAQYLLSAQLGPDDSMSSLYQTMWWMRLGLYALSAALSPPCSYVRIADGDTFSLIVVDGGWSFASKLKMPCCPSGNEPMQRSIEANSTIQS